MIYLRSADSTNSVMLRLVKGTETNEALYDCMQDDVPLIYTTWQSSGRGQTGNTWESEDGKNLLFTYLLKSPAIPPTRQFALNMIASVSLHRTVARYMTEEQREHLKIKWPNDLYYKDRKLAGILVENILCSNRIEYSIAGIGLNVNQLQWTTNIPNPISIQTIIGAETDIHQLIRTFETTLKLTLNDTPEMLHSYYMAHLYRREEWAAYREREVSTTPTNIIIANDLSDTFIAKIKGITEEGCLQLERKDNTIRSYHFKQIQYVISGD